MAQLGEAGASLLSNNPYKAQSTTQTLQLETEQKASLDSEKQVVSSEASSGPDNAPMVVKDDVSSPIAVAEPEHEANKEVVSSWQTASKEENAPIPMQFHESQPQPAGNLLNDVKGPPPDYDSNHASNRGASDDWVTTPSTIEPDSPGSNLPPRPEDRSAVGQVLSWIPPSLRIRPTQMPRLAQPVVIPQLDIPPQGESVPFTRCYSDALALHDVPLREFLAFLDSLAIMQAPGSTLQGLKMFGVGVNSIPLPIIPMAGKGIAALATSGSGHSSSRAKLYLERAKKEYFAPRGLHLTIIKDGDLNTRLQIPAHASRLAPLTKAGLTDNCCRRRLNGLAPYVSPLRFNVPEPDKQLQGVQKMARRHLESRLKGEEKKLSKLRERQWEDISRAGPEMAGWEEQYAFKMGQLRRVQDEIVDDQKGGSREKASNALDEKLGTLRQLQQDLQTMESQRYMAVQTAGGRSLDAETEEVNLSRRLKWIVIENVQ